MNHLHAVPSGSPRVLRAGRFSLPLDRPLIMGVVNVTPDSFSDGGRYLDPKAALAHARKLVADGADILDVGGESSRPGAQPVGTEEELRRILPVVEGLAHANVPVSVDTMHPEVMRRAIAAGASMINDILALQAPGALEAVAESSAAVCLMHMQGEPRTMQASPRYENVVAEVREFLAARVQAALEAGIGTERIVIDPGFGFGKTARHNIELLRHLHLLQVGDHPLLAGLSRKSLIGKITGRGPDRRLAGSLAAALLAVRHGARIVRVHDVAETCDALLLWRAVSDPSFEIEP